MCKISINLRLSKSKTTDITKLKYYWLLLRKNTTTNITVGNIPINIVEENASFNYGILKNILNQANPVFENSFLKNGDKLLFYISCKNNSNHFLQCYGDYSVYSLCYKNNIWKKCKYKSEEVNKNIFEVGKIESPFPLKKEKKKELQ